MVEILTFLIITACFIIFLSTYGIWSINQARRKGLYTHVGRPTMFDARRLILKGEKELAIRVYREIFKVNYSQAQKAVEDLEKSIQEKKSRLE